MLAVSSILSHSSSLIGLFGMGLHCHALFDAVTRYGKCSGVSFWLAPFFMIGRKKYGNY